ncbi:MAG TPA: cupin domain-containing protein [Methylomirabilota bacterium]|nr:cupin domain-containing protein [Methylomirabilota bacterium]
MLSVEALRRILHLVPHPVEGGYFAETYRCPDLIPAAALPAHYGTPRAASTAIYYLLTPDTFSAMHRLASDEIFHFYLGDPVEMLHLHPDGTHQVLVVGPDLEAGQRPQVVVPRHIWQGARLLPGGRHRYALLGTTVAPGFDYTDYETARRATLLTTHPTAKALILALTR